MEDPQLIEKQELEKKVDDIVRKSMFWAMGAGVLPIPVGDMIAVAAVQLDMLKQLSNLLGKDYTEIRAKAFMTALNGSILARLGASLFKGIPFIGPILGGISMSVLSGASTFAIGHVFAHYIMEYGTIENIDMDEAQVRYQKAFEKGKAYATSMDVEDDADDVYTKLDKLGALHKSGIITKKEFEEKKKKLMDQI